MKAVASKLGIGSTETLRSWVRREQIDSGTRPGPMTEESAQLKALKKENAELKRANELHRLGRRVRLIGVRLAPLAADHEMALVPYRPLKGGFLSGK